MFEAFSGIGAQRKALENLGIDHEVVAISEIDKHANLALSARQQPGATQLIKKAVKTGQAGLERGPNGQGGAICGGVLV